MWTIRVAVRIAPREMRRARDRNLTFKQLVIRLQVVIVDGPIRSNAVLAIHTKIGRMKTRGEGCPVNRSSSDTTAAVVLSQGKRILAAGNAQIRPVELMRTGFIADPVAFGVPERTGLEADNGAAGFRQTLQQNASGRTDTNNDE